MPDYARIYRRLHPATGPRARQRELSDLWPVEQDKFRRTVDVILETRDA